MWFLNPTSGRVAYSMFNFRATFRTVISEKISDETHDVDLNAKCLQQYWLMSVVDPCYFVALCCQRACLCAVYWDHRRYSLSAQVTPAALPLGQYTCAFLRHCWRDSSVPIQCVPLIIISPASGLPGQYQVSYINIQTNTEGGEKKITNVT